MLILVVVLVLCVEINLSKRSLNQDLEKYVAASTEDLARLFQLEKDMWLHLKAYQRKEASESDKEVIEEFLTGTKFLDIVDDDSLGHVSDPFQALQCLKRTAVLWEKLISNLSKQSKLKKVKQFLRRFPERDDFEEGGAFGLMTIQHHYNISYKDIMEGRILTSDVRLPTLEAEDAFMISKIAKYVQRIDKQVEWIKVALEYCTNKCDRMLSELRQAEEDHDHVLMTRGLGHVTSDTPDGLPEVPVFTFKYPILETTQWTRTYNKSLKRYEKESRIVRVGDNIKRLEKPTERKYLSTTFHRMWYYGHNITRGLCSEDDAPKKIMSHTLNCINLHQRNPFMRLGPFKYEPLSQDPHVGMFRDFMSPSECDQVKNRGRGRLKSTPFQEGGRTKFYTTQRVSKRIHITEDQFDLARTTSQRISLATRWVVDQEKGASDEYNVINYGLGGQIEVHVDYWNTDNKRLGGARIATFLTYLSHVEAGGRTVFPGLGLSVTPDLGSALFWLTVDTGEDYDSRMYHMGCPVARGNKWVMTKWIYSDSQMWKGPCVRGKGPANYANFEN